jgi:2-polyprenyl-3-methyl-5-hydroxy-6-metoxy-1,4-benzoquinol methylase
MFAIDMDATRRRFLRHVPMGGRILDVGCGSGRDAKRFAELGYEVEVRDRSPAIADEAQRLTGFKVGVEDVLEMTDDAQFDGIWASAMLLHLDEIDFREAVRRLTRALRPDGGAVRLAQAV